MLATTIGLALFVAIEAAAAPTKHVEPGFTATLTDGKGSYDLFGDWGRSNPVCGSLAIEALDSGPVRRG